VAVAAANALPVRLLAQAALAAVVMVVQTPTALRVQLTQAAVAAVAVREVTHCAQAVQVAPVW